MNPVTPSCGILAGTDLDDSHDVGLLPRGTFDTHVHVFDPRLGPYAARRAYTPGDAPLSELLSFSRSLSADNESSTLVLVQPSPYKTDCTVMLKSLGDLAKQGKMARGIAVIDVNTVTDQMLEEMHGLGVRGIRLNFQADDKGIHIPSLIAILNESARRIQHLPGWKIQMFVPGWTWDALHEPILALPVPVVADHLGGMSASSKLPEALKSTPLEQPGLKSLVSLAQASRVVIKVSGLYRMSNDNSTNLADTRPIIEHFAHEAPNQLIWGSDWPHTGDGHNRTASTVLIKEPFRLIDDRGILANMHDWVDDEVWDKMLRQNPKRLFH
ncbi:uncharacterized protein N7506_001863 [Penicillium brevicompactum]|uniref:uncharacterized protein n=1 Tax=Penicillium brevicompactum TaxID=5074 RepID=UPI002541A9C5|nr:uncharacterized protein N7506_001863 [Penicillium brevicompactum]KAJ5348610.1 hypothetical protein N7506_001863 [Penicillium brevicompactum]